MTFVKPNKTFWDEKRYPINSPERLGIPRTPETIRKWIDQGIPSRITGKVVQLEGCYEGQELCTTREAYTRFLQKLNGFAAEKS